MPIVWNRLLEVSCKLLNGCLQWWPAHMMESKIIKKPFHFAISKERFPCREREAMTWWSWRKSYGRRVQRVNLRIESSYITTSRNWNLAIIIQSLQKMLISDLRHLDHSAWSGCSYDIHVSCPAHYHLLPQQTDWECTEQIWLYCSIRTFSRKFVASKVGHSMQ